MRVRWLHFKKEALWWAMEHLPMPIMLRIRIIRKRTDILTEYFQATLPQSNPLW